MPVLAYTCKFCDSKGTAKYAADCPPLDLDVWRSMLCCNPCADFERHRRDVGYKIVRLVELLGNSRRYLFGQSLKETEEAIRGKLTAATRDYSRLLASHYRKPELWDEQFVDWLMDPAKAGETWKILGVVRSQLARMIA